MVDKNVFLIKKKMKNGVNKYFILCFNGFCLVESSQLQLFYKILTLTFLFKSF